MSVLGQTVPGASRTCPHCRATILESASVCPACRHHLRATSSGETRRARRTFPAFTVDGHIRHPESQGPCEYTLLVSVRDATGAEVSRQVVGVGALRADETRSFTLEVQVYAP